MALVRRFLIIVFGFFCVFTVLFLGDKIQSDLLDRRIDRTSKYNPVYRPYALWEESQLFENPNYDNLSILVEIDNKLLYLIDTDTNKVIKKYVVATGTSDTPTPIGTYKIVQKGKWGTGFGTRWIGINVPWGRYGIHGTNKPSSIGYNASHGCIRMRNKDVEELYRMVKYNTPVIIIGGPFGPFSHGFRILIPGDRGSDVQEVQRRLKIKGYYFGSLDGIYGDGMKAALIRFQRDNKMPITHKIGYSTYKKLDIILMD